MRTKHLIRELTKTGLTRPQAIKHISERKKHKLKNRQIFDVISSPFWKMSQSARLMALGFRRLTKTLNEMAGQVLRLEALEIDKHLNPQINHL